MIEIQPIQRVDMTQRIEQVRRRIAEIEEKIGINGDFQATLEREIARQAAMHPVAPTQSTGEVQQAANGRRPVNENEAANAARIAQALREAEQHGQGAGNSQPAQGNRPQQTPATPPVNRSQQTPATPPQINRVQVPDVEPEIPSRDEPVFSDNYIGRNAEVIPTEDLIMQTAYEYGVDPRLVRAVAIAESDMNQEEISPVGAIGVMQLMPETAQALGVDPYDRSQNIAGGTRYLRQMLDTFDGNVALAVAAYNAGPGAVQRYGGIPPYSETRNYVGRVMDLFQ